MTNARLGNLTIPHFFAGQVAKWAKEKKRPAITFDLAPAIQEVEVQTQILGSSFLKVHLEDPEWDIITSGLIEVEEDGLLTPIQVEYPEKSKHLWQLAAIEGSTELSQANLVLTFEDIIVARFREQWGHRTFPAGLTTRAQVVKALCDEVNLKEHLKPPIHFVCPGLHRKEPVEESSEEKTEKAQTTTKAKSNEKEKQNKESGPVTQTSWAESVLKAGGWPNSEQNQLALVGWAAAEGGAGPQFGIATNQANYNPLNTTQEEQGATNTGSQGNIKSYTSWAQGVKATVDTLKNGNYSGIISALISGNSAKAVAQAIGSSPWGTSAATVESTIGAAKLSSGGIIVGSRSSESDVGQLTRGTPQNPDEDSWDCGTRLAQQVDWFLFTGWEKGIDSLYYMDGPDLIKQKPVLYIDVPKNIVTKIDVQGKKIVRHGSLIRPLTFNYDNTTLIYSSTHKVKGKIQRKSRIGKPQTPSEIRLLMVCDPEEFKAGEVFQFEKSGPISDGQGRWILSDATRQTIKYPYTQFILVPPQEPLPEPRATEKGVEAKEAGNGSALSAFNASSTLSGMELPYLWGGGHGTNGLSNIKKGGPGLDCSGSTCWVLKEAGMFSGSSAIVSGELEKFGEAGKGKEMTVWANSVHVFIEFNIPGHGRAQMNTNGPQNGPRLYTLSQTMTYNPDPGKEGFTPRHFKGT